MKIVFLGRLDPDEPGHVGPITQWLGYAGALGRLGHSARVYGERGLLVPPEPGAGGRGAPPPDLLRATFGAPRRVLANVRRGRRCRGWLREERPDAAVVRLEPFDFASLAAAKRHAPRTILFADGPAAYEFRHLYGRSYRRWPFLLEGIERWNLARADGVVTVSDAIPPLLAAPVRRPLLVLPNAADTDAIRPGPRDPALAARLGLEGKLVVGWIGAFFDYSGLDTLCDVAAAFRDDPRVRFLVIGDGRARAPLDAYLATLPPGPPQVVAPGRVAREAVPAMLRLFDVLLAPYHAQGERLYGSPMKVFEALACGLPVVASDHAPVREAVEDGRTGILCADGDVGAFVAALRRLLDDAALRRVMGTAARAAAESRFSLRENARRLAAFVAAPAAHSA